MVFYVFVGADPFTYPHVDLVFVVDFGPFWKTNSSIKFISVEFHTKLENAISKHIYVWWQIFAFKKKTIKI